MGTEKPPDHLAQLRQALQMGAIDQATFDAVAGPLMAKAGVTGAGAIAQGSGATALGAGAAQVHGGVSGTLNLGVIIEQARQPGASADTLQRAYLARLLKDHNQLPLLAGEQGAEQVQLSQVYTALLTQRQSRDGRPVNHIRLLADGVRLEPPLSALAVLDAEARLVLMASPGGGKSTFVNVVAMSMAGELLGLPQPNLASLLAPLPSDEEHHHAPSEQTPEAQPWQHGPLLPVLVLLRDLASQLPPAGTPVDASTVWAFIEAQLKHKALGDYAPHLHEHLLHHGGLVLFDGLDEVPDAHQRRVQIKQAVQAFAATFTQCRLLVTSRTYAYQQQDWKLEGFAEVQLRPFDDRQMRAFIDAWYSHMAALHRLTATDAQDRAETLKRELQRNPNLRELAERPLLLTLIAQLQTKGGGALPQRREALYDAAVTMLLDTWERLKPRTAADGKAYQEPSLSEFLQVGIDQIRRQLNRLAFEAHRDQPELKGSADIPLAKLIKALMTASTGNDDVKLKLLQQYLRDRAGILTEHGVDQVQFPHRSFQEYLAACHLTDDDFPRHMARLARADPNRWREVALLAGAKAARGSQSNAWLLAEALCHEQPSAAKDRMASLPGPAAWGALLAGQVLAESAQFDDLPPQHLGKLDRIRDWQVAILRHKGLPAIERFAAGRHLAQLGDPRPEITLAGLQLVWVPPGPFWMGDNDDDDAKPCHEVNLPYGFAIGRHPVTAAQWRTYLEQSGALGTGQVRQAWGERQWPEPNAPMVDITWHEALAFCSWLTQQWASRLATGWAFTLPSEAEWEKAARGGIEVPRTPVVLTLNKPATLDREAHQCEMKPNQRPRRAYPWGDGYSDEHANVELNVGGLCAIGTFPDGSSCLGAEDMAGNVWEWTRSLWGQQFHKTTFRYPYGSADTAREWLDAADDVRRVVRGGSWGFPRGRARSASRVRSAPDFQDSHLGFRLLLRYSPVASSPVRRKR